jgi:restriction endonuclease S subunit
MEYFITYLRDIEGRIDPHYYRPSFARLNDEINKKNTVRISDIANVICGPFGSSITLNDYAKEGVPLIRISNIHEDSLVHDDLVFISNEKAKSLSSYRVKENDLIISQRGTLGLAAKVDSYFNGAIISANFIAIKDIRKIQPDYLLSFLSSDFGRKQLIRQTSGQVQTKITTDDVKLIRVPVIPPNSQNQVVSILQSAYQLKKQKETEAKKLLDSIDDYLLGELGIGIDFKSRLTYIRYSDQIKERLDPLFYSHDVYYFFTKYKGEATNLGDCIEYARSGFAAGFNVQATDVSGILQIRPTNISDDRRLVFDRNIYVKQEIVEKQKEDLLVRGEVLFNNTNSQELVGKSVLFDMDGQFVCSNHITRIKVKDDVLLPEYLTSILNLYQRKGIFYRLCTNWNNQSGINVERLKTVKIPLPTIEVQTRISLEIQSRMNQSAQLQRHANAEVERAKAEVERLILR